MTIKSCLISAGGILLRLVIGRNQITDHGADGFFFAHFAQRDQLLLEQGSIHLTQVGSEDLRMRGRCRALLRCQQFLEQFLAGTQAGEQDLDVLIRLQPRKLDQIRGQIDDALGALFTVMFTIVAIGMGLALSRMLTDKNWLVEKSLNFRSYSL